MLQVDSHAHAGSRSRSTRARPTPTSPTSSALHTYGKRFKTQWVTIHDTAMDGTAPFNANALAKAAGGTPFKRPENGQFRPGTDFKQFYFDETGDTDATSPENATVRRLGPVVRSCTQEPERRHRHAVAVLSVGDKAHSGFDNVAFLSTRRT